MTNDNHEPNIQAIQDTWCFMRTSLCIMELIAEDLADIDNFQSALVYHVHDQQLAQLEEVWHTFLPEHRPDFDVEATKERIRQMRG